jgi:hypothetical protein
MKFLFLISLIISILIVSCSQAQSEMKNTDLLKNKTTKIDSLPLHKRMYEQALKMKIYLTKNPSFDQHYAILIDMRQTSGKKRLFVYNLDSMKIISKGLVAHGSGSETNLADSLQFSNIPESFMSSLGKYKIGTSYNGMFGKSYKLHGLEKSNSMAFDRLIVLHRYSCVPDSEQPVDICNSLGCPMVSENYFEQLDKIIISTTKPMILEIFY